MKLAIVNANASSPHGAFYLEIDENCNVGDMKWKIKGLTGIGVKAQALYYKGISLDNRHELLKDLGMQDGDHISLAAFHTS
ncbi:hypothetical protein FCM35_KLT07403 [Carex littledalei]|uniref:Ubiquitin-like domain-containing protein n=1 Tax=Carex littledalei TaxID=544730 RepID=A0A833VI13_9POAL|nr:hypothetical protein FCM35_KLT07403 [Carex littledalei]